MYLYILAHILRIVRNPKLALNHDLLKKKYAVSLRSKTSIIQTYPQRISL